MTGIDRAATTVEGGGRNLRRPLHRLVNLTVRRPDRRIFVTGNGRSGTSWIGETLGLGAGVLHYREPCHPTQNGLSPAAADKVWAKYVAPGATDPFFEGLLDKAFTGKFWVGSGGRFPGPIQRIGSRPTVVVKEVASFASTEWVASRWPVDVVIILRHPGAFAASVANLAHPERDVRRARHLIANPEVLELLSPEIRRGLGSVDDPWMASITAWGIRTRIVLDAQANHPKWKVIKFADLAADPVSQFRALYNELDLPWTDDVAEKIRASSTKAEDGAFSTSRESKSRIDAWRTELSDLQFRQVEEMIDRFEIAPYESPTN
jgi:hypothetical protein